MRKGTYFSCLAFVLVMFFLLICTMGMAKAEVQSEGNSTATDASDQSEYREVYKWSDGSAIIISGDGDNVINVGALPGKDEAQVLPAEIKVFEDGTVILKLSQTNLELPDSPDMEFQRIIMELKAFDLILFEQ